MDRSDFDSLRRQALAEAAGANLGSVYSISESSAFVRPQPVAFMEKSGSANMIGAEYPPGTMEISADVSVVYLLRVAY